MQDEVIPPAPAPGMAQQSGEPIPEVGVLDIDGLARLLAMPKSTILTLRSRAPHRLPTPFRTHPLRWRAEMVLKWIAEQEQLEADRIARLRRRRSRA